jgi:hypothetical protein
MVAQAMPRSAKNTHNEAVHGCPLLPRLLGGALAVCVALEENFSVGQQHSTQNTTLNWYY